MADRTTKVRLTAEVNGYLEGMERARKATSQMSDDAQQKLAQQREAIDGVGRSMLGIGAVALAVTAIAVRAWANFDQKMSNVQAATDETAENMTLLSNAALEAGRETAYGAGEAADAITELAKAGIATADILNGGLRGALDLAAAGEIEVGRAAEIAATAMTQFGVAGSEVPHIADLLSAGANKAQGGVEDLSQALAQAGLVASSTGLSLEETVGGLSAFASAGLLGSDAGTSFRSMLQRLTPQSAEAKREMERLGLSAYDAQGNFIGLEKFAGNLQSSLSGLTDEQRQASLGIIFGSDAIRAANVLYDQGADGIRDWTNAVDDSGNAARTAAERLDNLNGDLKILQGSIDTTLIQSGSGANEVLRELVQTATYLVNWVGELPQPVLDAALAVTSFGGAIGVAGGAALLAIPRFAAVKGQLTTLGISGRTASLRVIGVGSALGLATIAISAFIERQANLAATTSELGASLNQATGEITQYTREIIAKKLAEQGAFDVARDAGISQQELTDAILQGGDAVDVLLQKMMPLSTGNSLVGAEAVQAAQNIRDLAGAVEESQGQWEDATAATGDNSVALEAVDSAAKSADDAVSELGETLSNFGKVQLDARAAARAFESAVDDARESIEEHGRTLDRDTEAGRANEDAIDAIARATNEHAAAVWAETGSIEAVTRVLEDGRRAYIETSEAAGVAASEAQELSDVLIATPESIQTQVRLVGVEAAKAKLASLVQQYRSGTGVSLRAVVEADNVGRKDGGAITGLASGGAVRGPGGPREDRAGLFRLSNGEHVLDAEDVRRMGGQQAVYEFRESLYQSSAPLVPASSSGGRSMSLSITVPVSAGMVASEDAVVRMVTSAIRDGVRNGTISRDWQDR